ESSRVVPLGGGIDAIEGGAIRGMNLFHSFEAFNVEAGRGVFFQNPEAIANILTRVTGGDPSRIFGTLGVLGDANLYLINPNGIIFGEQAQLDIRGSFFATTADSIPLGADGLFSATQPALSNLIAVDPGALFLNQLAQQGGIENRGRLAVGGDLTLAAGQLDLEGQLQAGGHLTLQGGEGLKIRDTVDQPFLAMAGRNLTLESQHIDIFALNHRESEIVAGGDLVLRSPLPVLGDAHYFAGGNFRIEEPGGELGQLESPNDPVIRARGDVSMAGYNGASLHILAAGNVTISGTIRITGRDLANGLIETVTLSDGSTLNINGRTQPTLDIRAGMSLGAIASPLNPDGLATITNPENSQGSNITLGTVIAQDTSWSEAVATQVFLTNQYQANTNLPAGNITVNSISTAPDFFAALLDETKGGNITLDSRNNINVTTLNTDSFWSGAGNVRLIAQGNANIGAINASSGFDDAGNVNITAQGDVAIANLTDLSSLGGLSGNLTLKAGGSLQTGDIDFYSFNANAGQVDLEAGGNITTQNLDGLTSGGVGGMVRMQAGGAINTGKIDTFSTNIQGGNVQLRASGNINVAQINRDRDPLDPTFFVQNGDIDLVSTQGGITTGNLFANASQTNGGNINITARNNIATGEIAAFTFGANRSAGQINLHSTHGNLEVSSGELNTAAGASSRDGGAIILKSDRGNINLAAVNTSGGLGGGGDVTIQAGGTVTIVREEVFGQTRSDQRAGNVLIEATTFRLAEGAKITSSTRGSGSAGNITIRTTDAIHLDGTRTNGNTAAIFSGVNTGATGRGGVITLEGRTIALNNGAQISTSTNGSGNAGNINLRAGDRLTIQGSDGPVSSGVFSEVNANATKAEGGVITATAPVINLNSGGVMTVNTRGRGNGGSIFLNAQDVTLSGIGANGLNSGLLSTVQPTGIGNGGQIQINTTHLNVLNGAQINSRTDGQGNAGLMEINARGNTTINSGFLN
ncbi:MAG: filamentous hemagglutinin N-terminal domain-containing protein, partial [Spirulina sp. DLM2.Bin59]